METFPHKTLNPFIQLDWHNGPFFPLIPGSAFHIGAGMLIFARAFGDNKENNKEILANSLPVHSQHHTVEKLILPHLNLFPVPPTCPNWRILKLIWDSENKCQLCALKVRGPDGPIAVSLLKWIGINQACNDPFPLPTSIVVNWGSVIIGITLADIINALLNWLFDVLMTYIEELIDRLLDPIMPSISLFSISMGDFSFSWSIGLQDMIDISQFMPEGLQSSVTNSLLGDSSLSDSAVNMFSESLSEGDLSSALADAGLDAMLNTPITGDKSLSSVLNNMLGAPAQGSDARESVTHYIAGLSESLDSALTDSGPFVDQYFDSSRQGHSFDMIEHGFGDEIQGNAGFREARQQARDQFNQDVQNYIEGYVREHPEVLGQDRVSIPVPDQPFSSQSGTINMTQDLFSLGNTSMSNTSQPTEIILHPQTGEYSVVAQNQHRIEDSFQDAVDVFNVLPGDNLEFPGGNAFPLEAEFNEEWRDGGTINP